MQTITCSKEKHGYEHNCSEPMCYLCPDPEGCDDEHNENTLDWEQPHHYGCPCDDCMLYCQRYLK